jgi:hypothetical protein
MAGPYVWLCVGTTWMQRIGQPGAAAADQSSAPDSAAVIRLRLSSVIQSLLTTWQDIDEKREIEREKKVYMYV